MRLTIELVPATAWGHNVRSEVSKERWDIIRRECYKKAKYVCEICFGKGVRHPVECHEIWEYDDVLCTQTLVGFVALCPMCHKVKHMGRAIAVGQGNPTIRHFAKVNGIPVKEALTIIDEAFNLWQERSTKAWVVDITHAMTYV